jgi:predicted ATPase
MPTTTKKPSIRTGELAELRAALRGPSRLVSLVGPPGVGKSWLAEAALDAADELGFDMVLESLPSEGGLTHATKAVVLLEDVDGAPSEDLAGDIAHWLEAFPGLTVLTAGRFRFHAPDQHLIALDVLAHDEAIALFEQAATQWRPGFRVDDTNRDTIAALVDGLDRLPLAIELAAARTSILTPRQMLDRLDRRFDLLASDAGRSLRDALAGSWQTLDVLTRATAARLGVFRGSFTLDAAEHVVDAVPDGPSTLDVIQRLLQRSLLSLVEPTASHTVRYRFLNCVRDFAQMQLQEAGDARPAERRHAAFFADAAHTYRTTRLGVDDLAARRAMSLDLPNLQAACARFRDDADAQLGHELCVGLADLLIARRAFDEAAQVLTELSASDAASRKIRAEAVYLRATLAIVDGDFEEAETLADRAATLLDGVDTCHVTGWLAHLEGYLASVAGRATDAQQSYERGLQTYRELGFDYGVGLCSTELGRIERDAGDLVAASRLLRRALELLEPTGNDTATNRARALYGLTLADMGETDAAIDELERCVRVNRDLPPSQVEPTVPGCAGFLYFELGDLERADELFAEQLELIDAQGYAGYRANALLDRGILALERGEVDQAQSLCRDALELSARGESMSGFSTLSAAQSCLAIAHAVRGNFAEARKRLDGGAPDRPNGLHALAAAAVGLLEARHSREGGELAQAERLERRARARLDEEAALSDSAGSNRVQRLSLRRTIAQWHDAPAPTTGPVLELDEQARWFAFDGGERVDLSRRGSMRRLLLHLARTHLDAPGTRSTTFELLDAGWPDDTVSVEAGTNRVYTTMSRLRGLGLEEAIRTDDEGYFVNEPVVVHWQ